jgi:hypothetical protein
MAVSLPSPPAAFMPVPPSGGILGQYKGERIPGVVQLRWNYGFVTDMVETWPDIAFTRAILAGAQAGAASIRSQYRGWGTGRLAADVETPSFIPIGAGHWTGFIGSNLPYAWMEDQGIGDKVIKTTKGRGLIPINAPARLGMVRGSERQPMMATGGARRRGQYQFRAAVAWVHEVTSHPAKNYLAAAENVYLEVFDREMKAMYPG